jgi:hypothetical protein
LSRRKEIGILVALLVLLAAVLYWDLRPAVMAGPDGPRTIAVQPLRVPNPALHLGRLAEIRQMDYKGNHRNIFSATAPPPAPPKTARKNATRAAAAAAAAAAHPSAPAGLNVPFKFYGMAIDPKSGRKLAFFTSGDHVYIASKGQTLLGHFRLLQIGNNTVSFEDVATGQTATLTMTPPITH